MKKMYEIFRIDGSTEILVEPDLKSMQNAVGGLIEYIPQVYLPDGNGLIDIIVNEEGLINDSLPNMVMSILCKGPTVMGDAIVVTENGLAEFLGEF